MTGHIFLWKMAERKPKIYAVIAASYHSAQERAYAVRMGILREPQWPTSGQNDSKNVIKSSFSRNSLNLGDPGVLPAADIKSDWGSRKESKTGKVRRMR